MITLEKKYQSLLHLFNFKVPIPLILSEKNSIAKNFLSEIRDKEIQKDSMRFRRNLERMGEIFAYEISKSMEYEAIEVETVLGTKSTYRTADQPVVATVLRASLPLFQGVINFFDKAESAFIGAYRGSHAADQNFKVELDYITSPSVENKTLILCDPILATGKSLEKAYRTLTQYGKPKVTHVVSVIASVDGMNYIRETLPECKLWIGDVDREMNEKFYIVPGLGDAGDLAFGCKL
jgi:uracil phosphoribosyltransferase